MCRFADTRCALTCNYMQIRSPELSACFLAVLRANLFLKILIVLSPFYDCIMRATYFYFAQFRASPLIPVPFSFFKCHKRPVQTHHAALFGPFSYIGFRDDLCSRL